MKLVEKHIANIFISIALFLVFGNSAFAGEIFEEKEKPSVFSEIQENDHDKPFLFNEVSLGEASHTISQNEHIGFGFYRASILDYGFANPHLTQSHDSSYSSIDKRELIFRYLFAFHFFW